MNIGTDPAFLAEVAPTLPATIEGISRSRAGRGPRVWDLLAYYSALLRVESLRVSGRILVRTDGQLPGWVDGSVRISLDVNGENIAPALLEAIRTVEKRVGPIEKETIDGWSNEAERPIRQVIDQERARARRADRAFSSRGVYDLAGCPSRNLEFEDHLRRSVLPRGRPLREYLAEVLDDLPVAVLSSISSSWSVSNERRPSTTTRYRAPFR